MLQFPHYQLIIDVLMGFSFQHLPPPPPTLHLNILDISLIYHTRFSPSALRDVVRCMSNLRKTVNISVFPISFV